MRTLVIPKGTKRVLAPKSKQSRTLIVENRGNGLHFTAAPESVRCIAGKGMSKKVQEPLSITGHERPTDILEREQIMLTTPEEDGQSCVYLDEHDGAFAITGGSAIIDCIEGPGLRSRVEPESRIEA